MNDREILFEAYDFSRDYRKLYVFRCFWPKKLPPGQPNVFPRGGYSFKGRINSALAGRRNVGGTMLALALANVDSPQTAINKLQALANQRLNFGDKEAKWSSYLNKKYSFNLALDNHTNLCSIFLQL